MPGLWEMAGEECETITQAEMRPLKKSTNSLFGPHATLFENFENALGSVHFSCENDIQFESEKGVNVREEKQG